VSRSATRWRRRIINNDVLNALPDLSANTRLVELRAEGNAKLTTLPLINVTKLFVIGQSNLASMTTPGTKLLELYLVENAKLATLPTLSGLSGLQRLNLTRLPLLEAVGALPALNLAEVYLVDNARCLP
jgi:hypothetical protein